MLRPLSRFLPLVLVLATLPAAANEAAKPVAQPLKIQLTPAKSRVLVQDETARSVRLAAAQRADNIAALLANEMVLGQGQSAAALAGYMLLLERTRDVEVAERGVEVALALNAIGQAEALLARWQELQPAPSAAQKRMQWELALARGETATVVAGMDEVLAAADDLKIRRLFLRLAHQAMTRPEIVTEGAPKVMQAARKHPDMPEAMIAHAIFAASAGQRQDAVEALNRLARLDTQMRPQTRLTLSLISQRQPQVLSSFFKQNDIASLSPMWQSLYLDTLIHNGEIPQAYAQLQRMLAQNPDAGLYLQAAFLSVNQKAPQAETLGYLEKAYGIGTQEQKSRAAFLAATRLMEDKQDRNLVQARMWAARVTAKEMAFDRELLLAAIEADEQRGEAAMRHLAAAQAMLPKKGVFYDAADLERLRAFVIQKYLTPAQAEAAYTRQIQAAEKMAAGAERTQQLSAALYQRGLFYADTAQQPQRAVADFRRYLRLNPQDPAGMNALGYTLLSLPAQHRAEAQRLIEAAHRLNSDSPAIKDSLGWVYFLNGDAEKALSYIQQSFAADPNAEVAAHLGEVLWTLGRQAEARAAWTLGWQLNAQHPVLQRTLKRLGVTLEIPPETAGQ
ncbi:tetratricopeptide (TPR) repeat protein [Neisseria sp. HSC-16F19]|nr:hypothetical protein [Neisseria sp. HSC-16F19]MCP2039773.1 tetratricopeptide (TPR) repeat protein [Neisseria sp. HSC-16F19]